jgi:hypothetical protein
MNWSRAKKIFGRNILRGGGFPVRLLDQRRVWRDRLPVVRAEAMSYYGDRDWGSCEAPPSHTATLTGP